MKRILVLAALFAFGGQAFGYGAVYCAPDSGVWTYAVNAKSKSEAESRSSALCKQKQRQAGNDGPCKRLVTFDKPAYFAIASSPSRISVWTGATVAEAESNALDACAKETPTSETCQVDTVRSEQYGNGNNSRILPVPGDSHVVTTGPTQYVNRVTCRNQCTNGNCLRTFADGRQERWQAPRVFDPFISDWKWDIDTNACGR